MEAAIPPAVAANRRRRKTLAPGELQGCLAGRDGESPNVFEVLVEDTSTDSSSDESCFSDVPFEAAMQVVGSPEVPGWSTVVRRGVARTRSWRLTSGRTWVSPRRPRERGNV